LSSFVLDASTAISWCFEEVQTPYAIAVLQQVSEGAEVHVPHVWGLEVTNALVKALRRQHITRDELFEYAQQLGMLRLKVDSETAERAFGQILALAERYQMTTYDASYLELAQRRGVSIATADRNLVQAAGAVNVSILQV
jgi:predicted nucleic acid-binding protein